MTSLSNISYAYIFIILLVLSFNINAEEQSNNQANLDSDAAKTALAFSKALKDGDASKARSLLADDVLIYEGGGVERTAQEYASHHLKSDIAFMQKMDVTVLEHQVQTMGNMAISTSRSKLQGFYKGKQRNIETMETLVLIKMNEQWLIKHIHWSN